MKSKNLWSVTSVCVALLSGLFATASFAKLPEPTPEAKAKAAEAKAKTAWSDKVAAYQLCKSQDKVAAAYLKGKDAKAVVATPACTDPGRMCRKSLRLRPVLRRRPLLLRQRLQATHLLYRKSKFCPRKIHILPLKMAFHP
jgi:hypothetical protein